MKVLEYKFSFICPIEPKKDSEGKCIERRPSSRYAKKHIHKLHGSPEPFCDFSIDKKFTENTGVYIFLVNREIKYAGRSQYRVNTDHALRQRIRDYGNISPRNCYDPKGQSTNCRINKIIMDCTNKGEVVELYFLELEDQKEIENIESRIITEIKMKLGDQAWNLQL